MDGLKGLIDAGVLDPDFASLEFGQTQPPPTPPHHRKHHLTETDENHRNLLLTIHRSQRQRSPSPILTPQNRTGPQFSHIDRPNNRAYSEDVIDTSDEEEMAEPTDKYQYYREVGYHWIYSGKSGPGWWHFSQADNERLERKYQSGKDRTKLEVSGQTMIVDFNDMTQRNGPACRNILRVETLKDIYLKGIAGSAVEGGLVVRGPDRGPKPGRQSTPPNEEW